MLFILFRDVYQGLLMFLHNLVTVKDCYEWLLIVPLCHFVGNFCEPYQVLKPDEIHRTQEWWGLDDQLDNIIDVYKKYSSDKKTL